MLAKGQGTRRLDSRMAAVGALLAAAILMMASEASAASSVSLCVSSKHGVPVTSGECPASTKNVTYTPVVLPSEPAAQRTLISILPYIKFAQEGVGGKPTIQVAGANLQIVSGSGKTNGPVNGAGNLIIGYGDEAECPTEIEFCPVGPRPHTGSHNLVLGTGQGYTSWGAILGGVADTATAPGTFVVGLENSATEIQASVTGGLQNTASGFQASVSGGGQSDASGPRSSVSGGNRNHASGATASVSGGRQNRARGLLASVVGGVNNTASEASVGSAILGGSKNTVIGESASISGGRSNTTGVLAENSAILGGVENNASASLSSVSGGERNTASGRASSILGGKGISVECELCHSP